MANGVNAPGPVSFSPISVTREGGIQAGAIIIDNMNVAPLMEYYNNINNMWKNVNTFGSDLLGTIYKWKEFEYSQWNAERKQDMLAAEARRETLQIEHQKRIEELMARFMEDRRRETNEYYGPIPE